MLAILRRDKSAARRGRGRGCNSCMKRSGMVVVSNLVPMDFPFEIYWEGREKTLASAGHVILHKYFVDSNLCNRS